MSSHRPTDVRVVEVQPYFGLETPSAEFAFGAGTAGSLTLAHARVRVEDARGRSAQGWGAIFLSHPWAMPGPEPAPSFKDAVMREITVACGAWLMKSGLRGHPLDHYLAIAPELDQIASDVGKRLGLSVPVPPLSALVACSPIDAAIHDAYGNLHGISAFDALGADHLGWDLSRVFGNQFAARYPGDYLRNEPVPSVPISHTVGATDPLHDADRTSTSIPALPWWIARDGVWSFKVKLKGQDPGWDVQRLIDVHDVARAARGTGLPVRVFGDLNEGAPSTAYIGDLLTELEIRSPPAFAALDALEQPLSRDLNGSPSVIDVASRVPIVLDEGLTSLATLDTAIERGWNGIALKTCKTQSLIVLALARATASGMAISVQDLTNPGIALLQSVGLAARLPVTVPIETNQRQYFPATSAPEADVYPDIFNVRGGQVPTATLTGPGLGYGVERIDRTTFRVFQG